MKAEESKWISVEDRLPEIPKHEAAVLVIAKTDNGIEGTCMYGNSGAMGESNGWFSLEKITHWKEFNVKRYK